MKKFRFLVCLILAIIYFPQGGCINTIKAESYTKIERIKTNETKLLRVLIVSNDVYKIRHYLTF